MKKMNNQITSLVRLFLLANIIFSSACNTLKPIVPNDSLQTISAEDLSKFNGDYEIFSIDSSFRTSEFALTYSSKFDFHHLPDKKDKINLAFIDSRHLKVTVYQNDKLIKTKIIKEYLSQNYFQFRLTRISTIPPLYFILNSYATQKNRIGLLKTGDLTLDTHGGGILLLVVMPSFGSGSEHYNLVFKRRPGSN